MYKKYLRRLFILGVTILITSYAYINAQDTIVKTDNINLEIEIETDSFTHTISQHLYYPDEEIMYVTINQTLTNPIYIGKGNIVKIYGNIYSDNPIELYSGNLNEFDNQITYEFTNEQFNDIENIDIQIQDKETETILVEGLEYVSKLVEFEDLSDYNISPKKNKEKEKEINYFIYQYVHDPLWEIDDIDKNNPNEYFKGNVSSQHNYLKLLLDNSEYNANMQDEVIEYFSKEIPNSSLKKYRKASTNSEKAVLYNTIVEQMQQDVDNQISMYTSNITSNGYMTSEEIINNTSGMNIKQQRDYLKNINDEILNLYGIDNAGEV